MELSPTAKVILGMLSIAPQSGYEIKSFVDNSTRFFWAASYGQIYPELRKLEGAGLIEGEDLPTGERKRTVYRLTPEGGRVLREWLGVPPEVLEMRHEGMLKVFFADALPPDERVRRLLDMRDQHLEKLAALRAVEAAAVEAAKAESADGAESSTYLILQFGIEFNQWVADWCERAAERLAAQPAAAGRRNS
jgi:PadR family transcriptional regulator, regulatory protein AphA